MHARRPTTVVPKFWVIRVPFVKYFLFLQLLLTCNFYFVSANIVSDYSGSIIPSGDNNSSVTCVIGKRLAVRGQLSGHCTIYLISNLVVARTVLRSTQVYYFSYVVENAGWSGPNPITTSLVLPNTQAQS